MRPRKRKTSLIDFLSCSGEEGPAHRKPQGERRFLAVRFPRTDDRVGDLILPFAFGKRGPSFSFQEKDQAAAAFKAS